MFGSRLDSLRLLSPSSVFECCYLDIEAEWERLSPIARLMYAKMRSSLEDHLYLDKLEASRPLRSSERGEAKTDR